MNDLMMRNHKNMSMDQMIGEILQHAFSIIYFLTGEEYCFVKKQHKHVPHTTPRCVSEDFCNIQSLILDCPTNLMNEKIMEHATKIIHLLTGEVSIRFDEVAVYFSKEEWEYLEGHEELYKDVMMEDHQTLNSMDGTVSKNMTEECNTPLWPSDWVTEEHHNLSLSFNVDGCTTQTIQSERQIKPLRISSEKQTSCENTDLTTSYLHNNTGGVKTEYTSVSDEHCISEDTNALEIPNGLPVNNCNFREYGRSFTNPPFHTDHQRSHEEETLCSRLNTHQRTSPVEKPYECLESGKWFTHSSTLVRNQKSHTGEKPFSCAECGRNFIQLRNLVSHQRRHTKEKSHTCHECGKSFTRNSFLVRHKLTHTAEKPFSCLECGKGYTQYSHLVSHQKTHTGADLFFCHECGKGFTQSSALVRHQRVHSMEKPFTCPECRKRFKYYSDLVRHQKSHTGEKPFSCTECGKCYTRHSHLVNHKKIHTGDDLFCCRECGKRFTNYSALKRHLKIHSG
ncbi:uncharacterized protein LOC142498855 [Ascaphus truei]|uniref:uncharacterized protein LOC142498855 n=1 Tax=Ascaphus truei TaxID=8439 RepID=UPI003F5A9500